MAPAVIHPEARTGAAIAGALLLALPALDVLLGAAMPGLVNFAVAAFGVALIAFSQKLSP
jgi:hypothetical protein